MIITAKLKFLLLKDFKEHVNTEHNMWNYIRFIIYVKSLIESEHNVVQSESGGVQPHKTKLNAVEQYVFDKVNLT